MSMDEKNKEYYKDTFDEISLDKQVQERIVNRQMKRKPMIAGKWVAAAIVIVVLGTSTTAFAMAHHFSFLKLFSSEEESGYKIQVKINKVDHTSFVGEISEVKDIILKQKESYEPYMSSYPLEYTKDFDSLEEAFRYVCMDVSAVVVGEEKHPATLILHCDDEGNILQALITTDYKINGNNVQIWYYVFSDLNENPYDEISAGIANGELLEDGIITTSEEDDSIIFEAIASEKIEYQIAEETLPSGLQVPIITSHANANKVKTAESYFAVDEIVYSINVASEKGDAEETLRNILKSNKKNPLD